MSIGERIGNVSAFKAVGLWYAISIVVAHTVPRGLFGISAGLLLLIVLSAYCAQRGSRGDLIAGIAFAPVLAAMAASEILGVPAWTVAYPAAVVALTALAWIERHPDRFALQPAGADLTVAARESRERGSNP